MDGIEKKKRNKHPERITLDDSSTQQMLKLYDQFLSKVKGASASYSEFVSFLISSRPPVLTSGELNSLKETFYDEVKFALWAAQEVKEARKRGENLSLAQVLSKDKYPSQEKSSLTKRVRKQRKQGLDSEAVSTEDDPTDLSASKVSLVAT